MSSIESRPKRRWTSEELATLTDCAIKGMSLEAIAQQITGRTCRAIASQISRIRQAAKIPDRRATWSPTETAAVIRLYNAGASYGEIRDHLSTHYNRHFSSANGVRSTVSKIVRKYPDQITRSRPTPTPRKPKNRPPSVQQQIRDNRDRLRVIADKYRIKELLSQ